MRGTTKKRAIAVIAVMAMAVTVSACAPPTPPPPPPPPPPPACVGPAAPPDPVSAAIMTATNASRAGAGLGPVAWNPQLWCLASAWSNHLTAVDGLVHSDLNATLRSSEYAGYRTLGENLLRGPTGMSGAGMHTAWMDSATHRANILSPAFNSFAVAFSSGGGQVFATENFGG